MNVLFPGFFGSNYGDLAVTRGAVAMLRILRPGDPIRIVTPPLTALQRAGWRTTAAQHSEISRHDWDFSLSTLRTPAEPPSIALVKAILYNREIRNTLRASAGLADSTAAFYCGGEHFFSYGNPGDDWNLLGRVMPALVGLPNSGKIKCLPATFGPLETAFSEQLMTLFFERCERVLARELRSVEMIKKIADIQHGLDPAFFNEFNQKSPRVGRSGPYRFALVLRQEGFGLRIGVDASRKFVEQQRKTGAEFSQTIGLSARVIKAILEKGHEVRVIVQCDADRRLAHQIVAKANSEKVRLIEPRSLAQFVREVSFCHAVVTSRFHSAIFALMVGALPIGFWRREHGHKMPGLFEMFQISDLCRSTDSEDIEEFVSQIPGAVTAYRNEHDGIQHRIDQLKRRTIAFYQN